jgi:hypothetical protein
MLLAHSIPARSTPGVAAIRAFAGAIGDEEEM